MLQYTGVWLHVMCCILEGLQTQTHTVPAGKVRCKWCIYFEFNCALHFVCMRKCTWLHWLLQYSINILTPEVLVSDSSIPFDKFPQDTWLFACLTLYKYLVCSFEKMENCSNGTSNCSNLGEGRGLDGTGFAAFSLLMALLSVAECVLTILTIVALCMARSMSKHLRIFLINILVAVLVMGVAFFIFTALSVILVFAETGLPPIQLCYLLLFAIRVGALSRPLNLSLYSVAVLVVVRFGKKDWKVLYSGLSITILWLIMLVMNTVYIVPPVNAVHYFEGVVCFPNLDASTGLSTVVRSVSSFFYFIFGGVIPVIVSVVIPVYCLHYIKKHSISGDTEYKKVISRLALFLITPTALSLAGNLLIIFGATYVSASVSVYLMYGVGVLSLLPTPILIIIFLKVVQDQMKAIITCHCKHSHKIQPFPEL